jgi:hypothetical protein
MSSWHSSTIAAYHFLRFGTATIYAWGGSAYIDTRFTEALALVTAGILRFAAHHNASHIFHETVTTAWMRLLSTHTEESFEEFIREQ